MYKLTTCAEFDSAHFLKDYNGKCSRLHGHRWKVEVTVGGEMLETSGHSRGMIVDFTKLRQDLKKETKRLDHTLIIEKGSLKESTIKALKEEGFSLVEMPSRPTAENLAKHFYDYMNSQGYMVIEAKVYETPNNVAAYSEV